MTVKITENKLVNGHASALQSELQHTRKVSEETSDRLATTTYDLENLGRIKVESRLKSFIGWSHMFILYVQVNDSRNILLNYVVGECSHNNTIAKYFKDYVWPPVSKSTTSMGRKCCPRNCCSLLPVLLKPYKILLAMLFLCIPSVWKERSYNV